MQPGTPLALYIFSNSHAQFNRFVAACPCGAALHNDAVIHYGITDAPINGMDTSGIGVFKGKFSFDAFTHKLLCATHSCTSISEILDLRYPPYGRKKMKVMGFLFATLPDVSPMISSLRFWFMIVIVVIASILLTK